MTPQAALNDLLARVGAQNGGNVFVNAEDLSRWPAEAVAALRSQKLLVKAQPAWRVVCPGCERECVMPVHPITGPRSAAGFIICDRRSDINRVAVSAQPLTRWRSDAGAICAFIAADLGIQGSHQEHDAKFLRIGVASGNKRRQMLCLNTDGELSLVAGNNTLRLSEVIEYRDGKYAIHERTLHEFVDSATTADPRYTPSNARREARKLDTQARYADWKKAYRELRKRRPNMSDLWYAQQIARQPIGAGRDAETIRKHLRK